MTRTRHLLALFAAALPVAVAQDLVSGEDDPVLAALAEGIESGEAEPMEPDAGDDEMLGPFLEELHGEEEPPPVVPEPEGVTVQVEAGGSGAAAVDASSVKLLAPFPAKPLFAPPAGWKLEHPQDVPAFNREVTLANGTRISLAIRPHLLVPDADGENVIGVQEPGYDPALRYAQTGTMSAVISSSVERMEEDSRKLGDALDRLSQLLSSLPSPEAPPAKETTSPDKKKR
jgi:hypothetical protein